MESEKERRQRIYDNLTEEQKKELQEKRKEVIASVTDEEWAWMRDYQRWVKENHPNDKREYYVNGHTEIAPDEEE